jgi:predicted O-linked N-acetylglucosamine transferase (SPINDLY family)
MQMINIPKTLQHALMLCQTNQLLEAKVIYSKLIKTIPNNFELLTNLGTIELQLGNTEVGMNLIKKSILINPNQPHAISNLGNILLESGKYKEAIDYYNKAILIDSNFVNAFFNKGKALSKLSDFKNAIDCYKKATEIAPNYLMAYINLGFVLNELKRYDEAISHYDTAIKLDPTFSQTHFSLGVTFAELKRYDDALVRYDRAIQLKPDYAEAFNNRGDTYNKLKRYHEALQSLNHAIHLKPDYEEAYLNRGVAFGELKLYAEALSNYDRAIQVKPDYAEAYFNRGVIFVQLKRYADALSNYDRAIQLKPDMDYLLGEITHIKMHLCDWSNLQSLVNKLAKKIIKKELVTTPFITLALIDNPELQKQSAEIFINDKHPIRNVLPKIGKYPKHRKIRIGYFSADFCNHPVSYLTAELFELHNRDQFEIIAFSFGVNTQDHMRQRLKKGFDKFIDVREKSDAQIASLAREMEIDIAVDLGGFTKDSRVNIFAIRAAPIQVSYIGYLGTMGAMFIDYLIADTFLIPQDKQKYYSEKIAYIPSYQVNDSQREVSEKKFTREEVGLPKNAFVFCCFNNIYKITPDNFDSWMRILNEVDQSVLLLLDANETATKNLKKEAISRGIDATRLVFSKYLPLPEYLARYRIANLFLDTLPYNAGTTASDALRVGLPVVTQLGESFAGRMAGSLLNALGLAELITTSQTEYESLAIELATNPEKLKLIKGKLVSNLQKSALYNTKLFAYHIELAYQDMYKRYQEEKAPDHIYVKN